MFRFLKRRVNKVSAIEAKALKTESNALFVDVRLPRHFAKSHVRGALNIDRRGVAEALSSTDRATPVVCYCYSGFSSQTACRNLEDAGFKNVYNLKGGYPAWKRMKRRA